MLARCEHPAATGYRNYGGRGIQVCERWHDARNFIADIEAEIGLRPEGRYPSGRFVYSLDRKDNSGNYEPGNVRWAPWDVQRANQRPMLGGELADVPDFTECGDCAWSGTWAQFDKHFQKKHAPPLRLTVA
jgi:hypothetical protein